MLEVADEVHIVGTREHQTSPLPTHDPVSIRHTYICPYADLVNVLIALPTCQSIYLSIYLSAAAALVIVLVRPYLLP